MAVTLASPPRRQDTEFRMVVRHTPFANQPETIKAGSMEEAWEKFLAEMPGKVADPSKATEAGQRQFWGILKNAQLEWLRAQSPDKIPDDVTIVPEADYRKRLEEIRSLTTEAIAKGQRESQSRNDDSIARLADAMAKIAESQTKTTALLEQLATKGK